MGHIQGSAIVLVISLTIGSFFLSAQDIPGITGEELPGYGLVRNDCFDGGSLWGYMNGGADIYLEYGFDKLRVEEFADEGETIKIEIFRMLDPSSAFGIYSIKTFVCKQRTALTDIGCLNPYSFQLVYGNYYIQIMNESGSERAKQAMIDIAGILVDKIVPSEFALPCNYLTGRLNLPPSKIKMIKGSLGIQDKTPELSACFKGMEGYQIYYARTENDGETIKYYEIVFEHPEMKNKFLENKRIDDFLILDQNEKVLVLRSPARP